MKPKVRRKEMTKIRVDINEIQTKKTNEYINKTKIWFIENKNTIKKKKGGFK